MPTFVGYSRLTTNLADKRILKGVRRFFPGLEWRFQLFWLCVLDTNSLLRFMPAPAAFA